MKQGDLHKSGQDRRPSLHTAAERTGNFRTSDPRTIPDRDLHHPHPGLRSLGLHFHRPTIALIAHPQPFERIAADRPKRSKVGVWDAETGPHEDTGDSVADPLRRCQAPSRCAVDPRTDDQIRQPIGDRCDQLRNLFRIVRMVRIQKDDHLR